MIQHERTKNGGSVTVRSDGGSAWVDYTLSNSDCPLSMSVDCSSPSAHIICNSIIENLVELHSPMVLIVESTETEIRYKPKIHSLFRCWGNAHHSIYAQAFSSRNLFNRVCSVSSAMHDFDIIRVNEQGMDFYNNRQVMSEIRRKTTPFEFLSIKEECDYALRHTSAKCVDSMVQSACSLLNSIEGKGKALFAEALTRIDQKQSAERGFDTKHAFVQEFCSFVLLPAVVKLGSGHPFTQGIFKEFSQSASEYISTCEKLIAEHLDTEENTDT